MHFDNSVIFDYINDYILDTFRCISYTKRYSQLSFLRSRFRIFLY